ncbi:unnamed protein product, partial [Mesorhabditis spiculigera]
MPPRSFEMDRPAEVEASTAPADVDLAALDLLGLERLQATCPVYQERAARLAELRLKSEAGGLPLEEYLEASSLQAKLLGMQLRHLIKLLEELALIVEEGYQEQQIQIALLTRLVLNKLDEIQRQMVAEHAQLDRVLAQLKEIRRECSVHGEQQMKSEEKEQPEKLEEPVNELKASEQQNKE